MALRKFTDEQEATIAQEYIEGKSARQLARERGCYHNCIAAVLRRQKVPPRSPAERNRLYALNPHKFDVIDCEWKAYFLGFLFADGSVHKRTLGFSLKGKDVATLQCFKMFMESESPIKPTESLCKGKRYGQYRIQLTDGHLTSRLRQLGIVKDRPTFNSTIDGIPPALLSHFLRGLFDGDGSFFKVPGMSFCGREDFMIWIRRYLSLHLFVPEDRKITKHPKANLYYLKYHARQNCEDVAAFMYRDATIWLERKREKFLGW